MIQVRKIIHIDMDAFYASVEQRDNPRYRGQPVAVGGSPEKRGAVAAASYEARKYGVHSAMPSRTAKQKCPHLIFVKPRFEVYRAVSQQIRDIFQEYTDLVEPLALDEAYLDVTENKKGMPSATLMAQEIKHRIWEETQLTASAGVSINKFLAKMACGMDKPNGLYLIPPDQAEAFVEGLAIEQFHGVGAATATRMKALSIQTGADLKQWSEADLVEQFGKVGRWYYRIARGQDDRPVNPNRIRKSVGAETSFDPDLTNRDEMVQALAAIAQDVQTRLSKHQMTGRTLTLKVKYANYEQVTRSRTVLEPIGDSMTIMQIALQLLQMTDVASKPVRLLGITIANLDAEALQHPYIQLALGL